MRTWAEAQEVPDGIKVNFVTPTGRRRTVEIVITPDEWDELAEVIGAETADSVKERLLGLEEDTGFLVCDSGVELFACATRDLSNNELDDFTPEFGGEWVMMDEAGNVVSRFADWNGEPD